MKPALTSLSIAVILFLCFCKHGEGEPISVLNLVLNKCCEMDEYFSQDGICINRRVQSNRSSGLTLPDSGGDLTNRFWRLPRHLFNLHDGLHNFTDDEISIDKFDSKRPSCNGKSRVLQKLFPGHITSSSESLFVFMEPSAEGDGNSTQNFVLQKNDFCIDRTDRDEFMAELCIPKCRDHGTIILEEGSEFKYSEPEACLLKCCMPHQLLDMNTFSCVDVEGDSFWHPLVNIPSLSGVSDISEGKESIRGKESQIVVSKIGLPTCQIGTYEVDFRDTKGYRRVSLLSSGNLLLELTDGKRVEIPWERFCIDGILDEESMDNLQTNVSERTGYDQIAIVCFDTEPKGIDVLEEYRPILFPILTGISSIFLLLTSITYIILWKDLYLPGWLQFSYTNSLLIAFSLLTIVQIWTDQIHDYGDQLCRTVGYTLHASFLSCFFWLTSMNIDLWCSFRNTPITTGFGRSRGRRRYFGFAMFSISIPVGVTIAAVVIDDLQRNLPENGMVKTEIGVNSCALNIQNKMAQLFYFYGVVGILFVVNLMFFFCTVLCLRERHRETKFAHRQCTASDSDLQRFRLFTRLFFIMGILWIFELISWAAGFFNLHRNIQLIFLATDCLNALQGVGIFAMFVWKRHTWKQLRKKYRKVLRLDSRTSLMGGPSTIKSSLKSSTKSGSVCSKTLSHT